MMHRVIISVALLAATAGPAAAQDLSVEEIVNRANLAAYYAGPDGSADVAMTITDAKGRERTREFRILRLDAQDGGEQKFYVYFHKPADVAKMVFMVWKHLGRDDDRWLYLPALDLVKRIAAGDKRSSFAGSHFVYEDVSGRSPDLDTHTLTGTEDNFYRLHNVPNETTGVEFAAYDIWVDRTTFLPMKAEYYDKDGAVIRRIEAQEVETVQDHPTVTRSTAEDLQRGGTTTMVFSNIRYDVGLTDDIFAERYLRKAPVQWIK